MNVIKLSIIIPVFNVETYIERCLVSVFDQDLPEDEYEVLCVNDGSIDGSRSIIARYLSEHPNLKLIDHPQNLKLGVARNTGRALAKGKYIWYVDADDWVTPNCFSEIIEKCDKEELDVLEFSYFNYSSSQYKSNSDPYSRKMDRVFTGPEYLERFHINNLGRICGIWRRVYRKQFLDNNLIMSPPINMGEDEPFGIEVFLKASRFAYIDKEFYVYRINEASLTGGHRSIVDASRLYEASTDCPRYMDRALKKHIRFANAVVLKKLKAMISYDVNYVFVQYPKLDCNEQDVLRKLYRNSFFENLFMFRYLGKRQAIKYVMWVFFNLKPQNV